MPAIVAEQVAIDGPIAGPAECFVEPCGPVVERVHRLFDAVAAAVVDGLFDVLVGAAILLV